MVPKAKPGLEDEGKAPSADELVGLLAMYKSAFFALTHDRAGATCEWKRYSKKSPRVMKVSAGDRTLFYLAPQANQFEVTVVSAKLATEPETILLGNRDGAIEAHGGGRLGTPTAGHLHSVAPRSSCAVSSGRE